MLQKEWNDQGKLIQIQHARTPVGEKVIQCEGLNKLVHYKVDGILNMKGRDMCVNTMDVISMVVKNVFHTVESHM